jgi:calcineurin-like phosphoesterase family protein
MKFNLGSGKWWLTSDWHLGHANIASPNTSQWKKGFRDFRSLEHMDSTIIDNINQYVDEDDVIVNLGDIVFGGHIKTPEYRRKIRCKNIILFRGNHDKHIDNYKDFFTTILGAALIHMPDNSGRKWPIYCHHSACRVWEGSHKGYLHAYGHSHSTLEWSPNGKSMDVGIDNAYRILGVYRPFSVQEFVNLMEVRKIAFHDHHDIHTNV